MSVVAKPLFNAQYAPTTNVTAYQVPSSVSNTIIDKITCTNISGGAVTVNIYFVPSGQAVDNAYKVISAHSIAAGAIKDFSELQNHILATSDLIVIVASSGSSIVMRGSGREVT